MRVSSARLRQPRAGVTLLQLLLALSLLGVLASLALWGLPQWRTTVASADLRAAARAASLNELTARTFEAPTDSAAVDPDVSGATGASGAAGSAGRVETIARWSTPSDWGIVVTHAWDRRQACVATAAHPTPRCERVELMDPSAGSTTPAGVTGTLRPLEVSEALAQWPTLMAERPLPAGATLVVADARALLTPQGGGAAPSESSGAPETGGATDDPAVWVTWRQGTTVLQSGPASDTTAGLLVMAVEDAETPVELWVVSASGRVRANGTGGSGGTTSTPEPFTISTLTPIAGEPVLVDGRPVRIGTDSARAWNWVFGSTMLPASSSVQNLVRFPTPGTYTISLSTRLQSGQVAVQSRTITVSSGGGSGGGAASPKPRAVLTASATYIAPNQGVTLSLAASTTPAAGGIRSYRFLSGAGAAQTGEGQQFATLFRSPGTYTALGIITDAAGAVDTARITITVAIGPAPLSGAYSRTQVLPLSDRVVSGEARVMPMLVRLMDLNNHPRGGIVPTVTVVPVSGTTAQAISSALTATATSTGETFGTLTVPTLSVGVSGSWELSLRTGGATGPVVRRDTVTFTGAPIAEAPVPLVGRVAITTDLSETVPVVAGQPIAPSLVARLRTLDGTANLAQANVPLTVVFQQGNGTLTGATVPTDATGQSVFAGLSVDGPVGLYQFSLSAEGYVPASTRAFSLTAGLEGSRLVLTQQPALTMVRGQTNVVQPTVRLLNADGSPAMVSGVSIAALVSSSTARTGTTLVGATATTNASGVATFASLRLNGLPGVVTLRFAANGYQSVVARSIDLVAAQPYLSLDTAWASSLAYGQASPATPVVTLRDIRDRIVGTAGSTGGTGSGVTVSINPQPVFGDLTLQPATAITTSGVARFADFRALSTRPLTRTVSLRATGYDSLTAPLTVTHPAEGGASGLRWQLISGAPAASVVAGVPMSPVIVQLVNASNVPVAASGYPLWLSATGGRNLSGQDSRGRAGLGTTDGQGRVSVGPVALLGPAGETQLVTRGREAFETGVGKNLPPVVMPVTLLAGATTTATRSGASLLAGTDGAALEPLTIQLRDASGNATAEPGATITLLASAGVTFAAGSGVSDGAGTVTLAAPVPQGLTGTAALTVSVTRDPAQVALRGGPSTFTASAGGLSLVGTPVAAGESRVPTNFVPSGGTFAIAPQVGLRDAGNRAVPLAGVTIALSLDSTGTSEAELASSIVSGGTAVTNASGVATFTGLVLRGSGTVRLAASAPARPSVALTPLTTRIRIAPAPVAALALTAAPTTGQVDVDLAAPSVELRDASGERVPEAGRVITVSLDPTTGWTGTLTGITSRTTDAAGRVTFPSLRLIGPAPVTGSAAPRLVASLTGATPARTAPIALSAGAQQSVTLLSGPDTLYVDVGAPLVFQLRDLAGNPTPSAPSDYRVEFVGGGVDHRPGMTSALFSTGSGGTGQATFTLVPRLSGLDLTGTAAVRSLTFRAEQPSCIGCPRPTVALNRAVRPGPARQIVVTQQPASQPLGAPIASAIRLELRDASGNPASGGSAGVGTSRSGHPLTIGVATDLTPGRTLESTAGTPAGLTAMTDASGVATFAANTLRLVGSAGAVSLLGSGDAPLVGIPGPSLTGTAGGAVALQWVVTPPVRGRIGVSLPTMSVRAIDGFGNAVGSSTRVVTLETVESGYTLTGHVANTTGSGTAGFTGLVVAGARGLVTLRATSPGLTGATAPAAMDLSSGSAAGMTLVRALPDTLRVDEPVGPTQSLQIQLVDLGGFPVYEPGRTVTLSLPGSSSIPAGRVVTTNASGLADFGGTRVRGAAPGTLVGGSVSEAGGLPSLALSTVTLMPGAPSQFTLLAPLPTTVTAGVALTPAVRVQLRDASGNAALVAAREVRFYAPDGSPGDGFPLTPQASALTNSSGVATLTPTLPAQILPAAGQSVTAQIRTAPLTGFTQTTPVTLTVVAAVAANLEIVSAPATLTVGVPFAASDTVRVQLRDASNNAAAQAGVAVTLTLPGSEGQQGLTGVPSSITGVSDGTGLVRFAVGGRAYVGVGGTRSWVAQAPGFASGTRSVTAQTGTASALRLATPPSDSAAVGLTLARQPVVEVVDQGGNVVTSSTGLLVFLYDTEATGVVLSGTTAATVNGVATFTGFSLTGPRTTYRIGANAQLNGQTAAVELPPIVLAAGPATGLSFLTGFPATLPSSGGLIAPPVRGVLLDASGLATPQSGVTVSVTLVSGPGGTLSGGTSQTTDAAGHATFSTLTFTGLPGTHVFEVGTSLFSIRDTVTVLGGPFSAAQSTLTLDTPNPIQASTGSSTRTLTATVRDASGFALVGQTVSFSATGTAATGVSFTPVSGVTNAQGQITTTVSSTRAGTLELRASVGGTFITTQPTLTVTPGPVDLAQTTFTLDATTAASPTGTVGRVRVVDALGNPLEGISVTLEGTPANMLLPLQAGLTDATGFAIFSLIPDATGSVTLQPRIAGQLASVSRTLTVSHTAPAGNTANLLLWLRADRGVTTDASSNVTSWSTQAAPTVAVTGSAGTNPVWVTDANGQRAVRFEGRRLTLPADLLTPTQVRTNGATFFVVMKPTNNGSVAAGPDTIVHFQGQSSLPEYGRIAMVRLRTANVFSLGTRGNISAGGLGTFSQSSGVALSLIAPTVHAMTVSSDAFPTITLRSNGLSDGTRLSAAGGNLGGQPRASVQLGNAVGSAGDLHEVIVYNRVLSQSEIQQIEAELLTRWAVPQDETIALVSGWPTTVANRGMITPTVQLYRNWAPVAEVGRRVAIASASAGWQGTVVGLSALTDATGAATLPAIQAAALVGSSLTIRVRASGSTAETGLSTTVTSPGAAAALAFVAAPTGTQSIGVAVTPNPVVEVRDVNGNPVTTAGVLVTASIASGTAGTLTGSSALTDALGRATFPALSVIGASGSRVLRFSSTGLTAVDASSLSFQAGPPVSAVTITAPSPFLNSSGQALRTQPVVEFRDAGNNATTVVNGTTATVVPITAGLTVSAGGTVTISSQRATFTALALTASTIGSYNFQVVETTTWVASPVYTIDLDGGNGLQTNLREWMRADLGTTPNGGNTAVTAVTGVLSGASYTFTGGSSQPWSATGLGGRPAITWNGATTGSMERTIGGGATGANMTLFGVVPASAWTPANTWRDVVQIGVANSTTSGSHYTLMISAEGAVRCVTPTSASTTVLTQSSAGVLGTGGGPVIVGCVRNGSTLSVSVNGVEVATGTHTIGNPNLSGGLRVGRATIALTRGDGASTVGEALGWAGALSSTDQARVVAMLKARWNIP